MWYGNITYIASCPKISFLTFFLIDIKNICKGKYPIQNMPPEDSAVCSRVLWAISGEEAESGSEFES